MKTPVTESTHITRLLERVALARPEIRLSLEKDGKESLLFLPTSQPRERLAAVLPAHVGERLLPFEGSSLLGRAYGFASPTDLSRSHTNDIHLFVNGRGVRDRLMLFAVRHAYRDALPPGRQPIAVVHLEIDPDRVDVNVHPAKSEVRFRESDAVRQLISHAIAGALGHRTAIHRDVAAQGVRDLDASGHPSRYDQGALASEPRAGSRVRERRAPLELFGSRNEAQPLPHSEHSTPGDAASEAGPAAVEEIEARQNPGDASGGPWSPRPSVPFAQHRVLGQLLNTYLVLERPGELVLLDQHAAHERILFERLRDSVVDQKLERQALLLPLWLELPQSAADSLREHLPALERVGYELEFAGRALRGGVRVGIKTVPALLQAKERAASPPDWVALLEETASGFREGDSGSARGGIEAAVHHVMATAACHAATRKGDRLQPESIQAILRQLDEIVWFPNCPHGRPISQVLTQTELERRFLRS